MFLSRQITYDDRAREIQEKKEPAPAARSTVIPDAEEEHDDLDIDDI